MIALLTLVGLIAAVTGLVLVFFKKTRRAGAITMMAGLIAFLIAVGATAPTPSQSPEMAKERMVAVMSAAQPVSYEKLARTPQEWDGKAVVLKGKVIQVLEKGLELDLRVNITQGTYGWTDTVYVNYRRTAPSRVLEDDIIKFYGVSKGTITYKSIFGQPITLPHIDAVDVENFGR